MKAKIKIENNKDNDLNQVLNVKNNFFMVYQNSYGFFCR